LRKIKLYIATSIDGYIASSDGRIDWLTEFPNPDNLDYGYTEFLQSIDTTLMGNTTYKQLVKLGIPWPYPNKRNFVFTRNTELQNNENISFVSGNIISFVEDLKRQEGKDIWLIGGSQVNTAILNAGLLDEYILSIIPVILGKGISLFDAESHETRISFKDSVSYKTGVVQLNYLK
jgi:dihydrofolate reductase